MNLDNAQAAMRQENIDCWVVCDFQNTNPIMAQLLPNTGFISRRLFFIIPAAGKPVIVGAKIDNDTICSLPYPAELYVSWPEMERKLTHLLADYQVIGLDYSPLCALPVASRIDAGTFEFFIGLGKTVKSAANVFQLAAAVWTEAALQAHLEDCRHVAQIKDEAFYFIGRQLQAGHTVTEYDAQQFIMQQFKARGLFTPHPPIVAVNEHSGDPHYLPNKEKFALITKDDWVLIDLWARRPGSDSIFSDITWVGFAGRNPPTRHRKIFEIVRTARDEAITFLQRCAKKGVTAKGWQVDDAVRGVIEQAGYGKYFFHRTGHSLGPGGNGHGQGANIDNLETHDTRTLVPGIGFSVEPGIYLPEFGVRLEINVCMTKDGPLVTTPLQQEIICLET